MARPDTAYPISQRKIASLRDPSRLKKFRAKARCVVRKIVLDQTPEILWPLLSHTDLLNQQVGMQSTTNYFSPQHNGGSLMHAQTKNGGFSVAYEEFPYIWDAPHVYAVERVFVKGPIKYLQFKVRLKSINEIQTEVQCSLSFVSILPPPLAKLIIGQELDKFKATFERLAKRLEKGEKGLLPFFKVLPETALATLTEKWSEFTTTPSLAKHMAHYFLCAPERLSYRLRPREFAAWYDEDPLEVLNLCLSLSQQGDLKMYWDCRCPRCKGPKESVDNLSQLKGVGYCESCATHYGIAFDQNLELTFSPAQHIRQVNDILFCAGSPGNTPHIVWQQIIAPGATESFTLKLPVGQYALRSLQFPQEQLFKVDSGEQLTSTRHFSFAQDSSSDYALIPVSPSSLDYAGPIGFDVQNQSSYAITLMLEDMLWPDLAVTAASVQCVQTFHEMFPKQLLDTEISLPLSHQVFLELHWNKECAELLQWSRDQLAQFQGAILDLDRPQTSHLRCIFVSAFEALSAAWSLQKGFSKMTEFYDESQKLTLAIDAGACSVSTLNQHMAYTGPVVENIQSVLNDAKALEGSNTLVSAFLFSDPEVKSFLALAQKIPWVKTHQTQEPAYVQFNWKAYHRI